MRMLARVEGMPLESLADGRAVGLADLRRVPRPPRRHARRERRLPRRPLGAPPRRDGRTPPSATKRRPSSSRRMCRTLLASRSRPAGSASRRRRRRPTTTATANPVPSRAATSDELIALARVVRDHPGTTLEFIPTVGAFADEHVELMADMSAAADRPLNWNVLVVGRRQRHLPNAAGGVRPCRRAGRAGAGAHRARGHAAPPQLPVRLHLRRAPRLGPDDGAARRARRSARSPIPRSGGGSARAPSPRPACSAPCCAGSAPHRRDLRRRERGPRRADGRRHRGRAGQGSVRRDARHRRRRRAANRAHAAGTGDDAESWQLRSDVWRDPRAVVGASDAGAHLDMLATFSYTTSLLAASRAHELLPLEEAVHLITDVQARLYGLRDRGRIAEGWHADLVVFDEDAVGPARPHALRPPRRRGPPLRRGRGHRARARERRPRSSGTGAHRRAPRHAPALRARHRDGRGRRRPRGLARVPA